MAGSFTQIRQLIAQISGTPGDHLAPPAPSDYMPQKVASSRQHYPAVAEWLCQYAQRKFKSPKEHCTDVRQQRAMWPRVSEPIDTTCSNTLASKNPHKVVYQLVADQF